MNLSVPFAGFTGVRVSTFGCLPLDFRADRPLPLPPLFGRAAPTPTRGGTGEVARPGDGGGLMPFVLGRNPPADISEEGLEEGMGSSGDPPAVISPARLPVVALELELGRFSAAALWTRTTPPDFGREPAVATRVMPAEGILNFGASCVGAGFTSASASAVAAVAVAVVVDLGADEAMTLGGSAETTGVGAIAAGAAATTVGAGAGAETAAAVSFASASLFAFTSASAVDADGVDLCFEPDDGREAAFGLAMTGAAAGAGAGMGTGVGAASAINFSLASLLAFKSASAATAAPVDGVDLCFEPEAVGDAAFGLATTGIGAGAGVDAGPASAVNFASASLFAFASASTIAVAIVDDVALCLEPDDGLDAAFGLTWPTTTTGAGAASAASFETTSLFAFRSTSVVKEGVGLCLVPDDGRDAGFGPDIRRSGVAIGDRSIVGNAAGSSCASRVGAMIGDEITVAAFGWMVEEGNAASSPSPSPSSTPKSCICANTT